LFIDTFFIAYFLFQLQDPDENRHRPPVNGGASRVEQERLKKLEAMERKQKELEDAKRDEERILREAQKRRQNESVGFSSRPDSTPPPPPLPAVPPPDVSPAYPGPSGAQRLDMLVGSTKKSETPTKKVSFLSENDDERRYDANANSVSHDEKISRLERLEKDPNVSSHRAKILYCEREQ
jgi:hypothetical protein